MKRILIIEGSKNKSNGILRQGFNKLLSQKLKGEMPKIIMGEGKSQAIKKFISLKKYYSYLLVDLDNNKSERENDINNNNLTEKKEFVFYMIQEMEAWFLSQPQILDYYYGNKISEHIPKRPVQDIANPSELLYRITKSTAKGKYHKVAHAVDLLQMLDAQKLINEFADFKNLIKTLKK